MLFAYLLGLVLALSTVLGRSTSPATRYVTYETEDQKIMQTDEKAQIIDVNDRSSNLKYVIAIQSSSIWEEIKKRSLTLYKPVDTVDDKSPDDLTDEELEQVKQACHDGLKCVAVDQLTLLQQVKEPLVGGKVSVRTVITKITKVLTQYTTEYHENVYQYEVVNESDDESKVNELVTTIVEDNKELCRIDFTPPTEENNPKNGEGNTVPAADKNHTTINFNTINNFNINNGTLNNATINVKPHSEATTDEPTNIESENRSPDHHYVNVDHQPMPVTTVNRTSAVGDESVVKAPKNDVQHKTTTADHPDVTGRTNSANTDESAANNKIVLYHGNGNNASDHPEKTANDRDNNNSIEMHNSSDGSAGGENDSDSDIVSAGPHNKNISRKGMVEDGILNNGNMKAKSFDKSNRNKGTIKDAKANNGIINVGTTNNGPTNYGTTNGNTNNGTITGLNNTDILQYVNNIDKMYSNILDEFAKY